MNYIINGNISDGVFVVPNSVADDNIKLASGKAVKVLLYIMRHRYIDMDKAAEIASALDKHMTDEDVEDAVSFWEETGVIRRSDKPAPQPAATVTEEKPAAEKKIAVKPSLSEQRAIERSTKMLSAKEIAERVEQSEELAFLLKNAETVLGRVLNNTEQRTLIWMHDYYSMGSDIILMIIDLCKSINKTGIAYIEKVAASWNDKEILTHEQAEAEILRLQNYYSLEGQVVSRLGLNRKLIKKEKDYVEEWSKSGVTIDLIEYAYEKTVNATGKAAFGYMNKILAEWTANGLKTITDVDKYNEEYAKNRKDGKKGSSDDNNSEHSYNLDLLIEHAMNNVPTYKED